LVQGVAAKLGAAALIATLVLTTFVMPAFATSDGVLNTSGYGDGYYYECTYTPSQAKMAAYSSGNYHSYHANGYHVECRYDYNVAPVKKEPQRPVASQSQQPVVSQPQRPVASQPQRPVASQPPRPQQNAHQRYNCTYTVQRGDHLGSIAHYYGTTYVLLGEANHLKYPYYIFPGNVLHVPCKRY